MQNEDYVDFSSAIAPIDFAREMFRNTAEDGTLCLNSWYDVDCKDCLTYGNYVANIKWTKSNLEEMICEFNTLINDLTEIADYLETPWELYEELDDSLIDTYERYVAPFETENKVELKDEVISRVSEGHCGYNVIRHAQRLCQLIAFNAPEVVTQREARMLIASLIIHAFGEVKGCYSWWSGL